MAEELGVGSWEVGLKAEVGGRRSEVGGRRSEVGEIANSSLVIVDSEGGSARNVQQSAVMGVEGRRSKVEGRWVKISNLQSAISVGRGQRSAVTGVESRESKDDERRSRGKKSTISNQQSPWAEVSNQQLSVRGAAGMKQSLESCQMG
jgi:hypothetical protein